MKFFVGIHQPSNAQHVPRAFISVNRLRDRKGSFPATDWIMDSGAFTELATHGRYRHSINQYAEEIARWRSNGNLLVAVSQDYMCEPFMLERTGKTILEHQALTIARFDGLTSLLPNMPIMPVLQGWDPVDYANHVDLYASRLRQGMWVGVGSICKRNGSPGELIEILRLIKTARPDLRLHGFGLKITALGHAEVRDRLYSADSMAWSWSARRQGRNGNDWREAVAFAERVERLPVQPDLFASMAP